MSAPIPSVKRTFEQFVTQPARRSPTRMILYATEGWGKTSFAAQAPEPIFMMTRGETGLWTLMNSGRLPANIAHFPDPVMGWNQAIKDINALQTQPHRFKTLVIDTANGLERILHEHVCTEHFHGEWGDNGFQGFQRGPRVAIQPLVSFLTQLDCLRDKGMSIILLMHAQVATFKNPEGPDYDRFTPAVDKTTWNELHRWADLIIFGHRTAPTVTTATKRQTKGKLTSTDQPRVLMTERRPSFDAKNRHGLNPVIECGDSPQLAWLNLRDAMRNARPLPTTSETTKATPAPAPDQEPDNLLADEPQTQGEPQCTLTSAPA